MTDLEKMVRSVVGEHIEVALDLCPRSSAAHLDQGQLEQVLLNTVLNARDAMPGGGLLTLRTGRVDGDDGRRRAAEPDGRWVTIAVEDTGIGMTPEILARVFEPFFTTKPNGTGLGLATAQQITRDLGGEITVESQVGAGTTFTLWLPKIDSAERSSRTGHDAAARHRNDTVLLVEDEPTLRNLVQIVLAEAGYHVLVASRREGGPGAGARASTSICLVTDVVMPGMSGPQLAVELLRPRPESRFSICPATSAMRWPCKVSTRAPRCSTNRSSRSSC